MLNLVLALLIGTVAGLRSLTAPAAISWAAHSGELPLGGSRLAFLAYTWTPWIITFVAALEVISDKLPLTPSRTVPAQFIARVVMGGLSGAALNIPVEGALGGTIAGAIGAIVGTLGGAWLRKTLVRAIGGKDLPIALVEDAVAIVGAFLIVKQLG